MGIIREILQGYFLDLCGSSEILPVWFSNKKTNLYTDIHLEHVETEKVIEKEKVSEIEEKVPEKNEPITALTDHKKFLVQTYLIIATLLITLNQSGGTADPNTISILKPKFVGMTYEMFLMCTILYSISLTPAKYKPKVKNKPRHKKGLLTFSSEGYKDYYHNTIIPGGKLCAIPTGFTFALIFHQFLASYSSTPSTYNDPGMAVATIFPLGFMCALSLWY